MVRVVDIADYLVTRDADTTLVTYSLGSCIGLAIWDPASRVAGLLHFMLPDSALAPEKANRNPGMFCDTGVPALFRAAYDLGAAKSRLVVKIAGGARLLNDSGTFNIGERNYLSLRRILWRNGVLISAEDVGGSASRTLRLNAASGATSVRVSGMETLL